MCLQKSKIQDYGHHLTNRFSYFNCGKCAACRQQIANSKVQKISSHQIDGFVRYFVSLTYSNDNIPVVSKADLLYRNLDIDISSFLSLVPIYRGVNKRDIICSMPLNSLPSPSDLCSLSGVVLKRNKFDSSKNVLHDDLVSVACHYDAKCFLKRLRQQYFREYKTRLPFYYYYSPEYGPDSSRFHLHFIMWFPKDFTESFVTSLLKRAWPFQSEDRWKKSVEIARAPEHYVASYVNCDASISKYLLMNFPLRQSHSLGFGFLQDQFTIKSIYSQYQIGSFGFDVVTVNKKGIAETRHFLYSKSLLARFFPKFKGYNSLSKEQIINCLVDPERFFYFGLTKSTLNENGKLVTRFRPFAHRTSRNGDVYYYSSLLDVHGYPISFTAKELRYTINRINSCFERSKQLFQSGNSYYNRLDWANFVYDYLNARSRYITYHNADSLEFRGFGQLYRYDNLRDVSSDSLQSLSSYIDIASPSDLDPNLNPLNLQLDNKYREQYYKNIKSRKLNKF